MTNYLRLDIAGVQDRLLLHALSPEPGWLLLGDPWRDGGHPSLLLHALLGVEQHGDGLVVLGVGQVNSLLLLVSESILVSSLGDQVPSTSENILEWSKILFRPQYNESQIEMSK